MRADRTGGVGGEPTGPANDMLRHPGAAYYDSLNQPPAVAGEPALQHTAAQVTGGHGDSPH